jgi:hypothetical protein
MTITVSRWIVAGLLFSIATILLLLALSGCGSNGLLAMSDERCAQHPQAAPSHCNRNPNRNYDVQGHLPPVVDGDLCPGRYELGAAGYTITCFGER